jgi:hypothetical protein
MNCKNTNRSVNHKLMHEANKECCLFTCCQIFGDFSLIVMTLFVSERVGDINDYLGNINISQCVVCGHLTLIGNIIDCNLFVLAIPDDAGKLFLISDEIGTVCKRGVKCP